MLLLYRDEETLIRIDFYKIPAILEVEHHGNLTHLTLGGDYIDGDRSISDAVVKWLSDARKEVKNVVWEWNNGNDDFEPIKTPLRL